ncbi:MAG: hypothetical protein WAL77_11195 [Candidatus Dormiibacterota bacterium]
MKGTPAGSGGSANDAPGNLLGDGGARVGAADGVAVDEGLAVARTVDVATDATGAEQAVRVATHSAATRRGRVTILVEPRRPGLRRVDAAVGALESARFRR